MAQDIYINEDALTPMEAFVNPDTLAVQEFPSPVATNDLTYNIYVVDQFGDASSISGLAGYSVEFLVGELSAQAYAAQTTWAAITNGWTGTVDLNTVEMAAAFAGEQIIELYVQITIMDGSGRPRTYAQTRARFLNTVVAPGGGAPVAVGTYLTDTETFDRFVQNRSSISGLTGGGATKLDGIVTVGVSAGQMVVIVVNSTLYVYQLTSGTTAESVPSVVRPDDYAGTTNEKIWVLKSIVPLDVVQNRSTITALTGGTATDLDGIATTTLPVGTMVAVTVSNALYNYQLIASTAAESSPNYIRPDDYGASNQKVWILRMGPPLYVENDPNALGTVGVYPGQEAIDIANGMAKYKWYAPHSWWYP